jgi:caveolin 1
MSVQEKLELNEQTPLKSDMDAPAVAEGTATVTETTEVLVPATTVEKKKFTFFTKKEKKTKQEETAAISPVKDVENGDAKKKGKCGWFNRDQCAEDPRMTIGVNLIQRDDRNLQHHIDLAFEDIYGEPDSVHSFNGIWRATFSVFTAVRAFFYRLFALIVAIPSAIVFAILFALVSVLQVFLCVPAGRLFSIPANWIFKAWKFIFTNVFDPVFKSVGQCFSGVAVRQYGFNNEATAPIV